MSDILLQILLFGAAGLVLAIVLPARNRLRNRSYNPLAQPDTSVVSEPLQAGTTTEVNPQDKFIAACLKRGRRPTPLEALQLLKKLERENWPVPTVQDVLDEFDQRRTAIAQRKVQNSSSAQLVPPSEAEVRTEPSRGLVFTHNGQPLLNQAQSATASASTQPPVKISEMKANTIRALTQLPKQITNVPYPDSASLAVPLIFDGSEWYFLKLVAGSHWGFFGVTRSGKGNALQHVALNALAFGPEQVQLIVLDAKGGLDYGFCDKISHATLYADKDIMDGANTALDEMDRRKALLKANDCRNHYEYERKTGIRLPLVIIIADEIAEFNDEQHNRIATLARTSGAMGGILMVATQYPVAKVLPTQIQANVGSRLVFRLASSDQIQVAMRRNKEDEGVFNPALITESMKGVGVLRLPGGEETLGRVPEVSDKIREEMITALVAEWPKAAATLSVTHDALPVTSKEFELKSAIFEGNSRVTGQGNAGVTPFEEVGNEGVTDEISDEMIAALLQGGIAKRQIFKIMKGKGSGRMERINRIEQGAKAEQEGSNDEK